MSPPGNYRPICAASRLLAQGMELLPLRKRYGGRLVLPVELAIGTVLSRPIPLTPWKEPHEHPLRFGWVFESRPLHELERLSVRRRSPALLAHEPIAQGA